MSLDRSSVDRNTAARDRLRALVARLDDADLARPLGGGWTVAAALAHLAFWDRRAHVLLARWERDGPGPSPVDVEALNDALLPQWLAIPPRVAAEDAVRAAEAVDRAVEAASPATVAAAGAPDAALTLLRAKHRGEHLDEIERALAD